MDYKHLHISQNMIKYREYLFIKRSFQLIRKEEKPTVFDKAAAVKLYVSDFHMGEGVESPNENFKYHPLKTPMKDTRRDYVLDTHFADFLNWVLKNLRACPEIQLYLNGDIFDFSAVGLPSQTISLPYEEETVDKFKIILRAHPLFFDALKRFCQAVNTRVKFFIGNHDFHLHWPTVQVMLRQRVAPDQPDKIIFLSEEYDRGTYCRHGESEPHTKTNHKRPIIPAVELEKLPASFKTRELNFASRDVLDVSISHYLSSDLMYNLKKSNYLISRMYIHSFVWTDGLKHIPFETWYRQRWFFFHASYQMTRTLSNYVFKPKFWHAKQVFDLEKVLRVLHWTFNGVLSGHTPRDLALKILHNQDEVDCVVHSHEHNPAFEVTQVNGKTKTYINTGTWTPLLREKTRRQPAPWKRLKWLQELALFGKSLLSESDLELIWKCPVAVETIDEAGAISRQLCQWDKDEKTLKQLS